MPDHIPIETEVEIKILQAAKTIFLSKGLEATTMQEIADEAQICRTSLHYYYRNKEKLFSAVFKDATDAFIPKVNEIINKNYEIQQKIDFFVDNYIDMLVENPRLPGFFMQELNRDPKKIIEVIKKRGINLDKLSLDLEKAANQGKIQEISLAHFVVNLISLCVFPFLAKPILLEFLFDNDENKFQSFIAERKIEISLQMAAFLGGSKEVDTVVLELEN